MSCVRVCLRLHFSLASARPAVTTKIHFRPSQKTLFFTFVSSFSKCTAQNVSNKLSRLKCEKNGIKTTLKSRIAAHNRNQFNRSTTKKRQNCELRSEKFIDFSFISFPHFRIDGGSRQSRRRQTQSCARETNETDFPSMKESGRKK